MFSILKKTLLALLAILVVVLAAVYFKRVELVNHLLHKYTPQELHLELSGLDVGLSDLGLHGISVSLGDDLELEFGGIAADFVSFFRAHEHAENLHLTDIHIREKSKGIDLHIKALQLEHIKYAGTLASADLIRLSGVSVNQGDTAINIEDFEIKNIGVNYQNVDSIPLEFETLQLSGIELQHLLPDYGQVKSGLKALSVVKGEVLIAEQTTLLIEQVKLDELLVEALDLQRFVSLEKIELHSIAYDKNLRLEQLTLQQLLYKPVENENSEQPLWQVSLPFTEFNKFIYSQQLATLEELLIGGGEVILGVDADKQIDLVPPLANEAKTESKNDEGQSISDSGQAQSQPENPGQPLQPDKQQKETSSFVARLDHLLINQPLTIIFTDKLAEKAVTHNLRIDEFKIQPLVYRDEKLALSLLSRLVVENSAPLNVELQLPEDPGSKGFLKLDGKHIELLPYSTYIESSAGYALSSGQLDINLQLDIIGDVIDGVANLELRKLNIETVDEKLADSLAQQITMPLPVALKLLKNSDGDIPLKIPVKIDGEDQQFGMGSVVGLLSKKAVKVASKKYFISTLFPGGLLVDAASLLAGTVYEKATALPPVVFATASAELDSKAKKFLDDFAKVLKKKESVSVRLCPVVAENEAEILADRESLAERRRDVVTNYIVAHGVDAKRLQLCKAVTDDKKLSLVYILFK